MVFNSLKDIDMVDFYSPIPSYTIRLNSVLTVEKEFTSTQYSCVIIDERVALNKTMIIYFFVDSGGNYYKGVDWGDGNVYNIRKISTKNVYNNEVM